jgi:DNA-binding LytR/AlgR family response regulator
MMDIVFLWGVWGRLGAFRLVEEKPSRDIEEVITVKKGYNNIIVPMENITWVAAENYYARIYTSDESFLLREPLKVLLDRLPENEFIQIHRSTLVRVSFIERFNVNELVLKDGTIRRISKGGMKKLRQIL